jgi:hypothetical protein
MLPTKFWFIWQSGFRGDFLEINQSETRIICGGHVCYQIGTKLAIFIRGLSIDASYQVSDMWFQRRRFFRNTQIDKSETKIACGGHVC